MPILKNPSPIDLGEGLAIHIRQCRENYLTPLDALESSSSTGTPGDNTWQHVLTLQWERDYWRGLALYTIRLGRDDSGVRVEYYRKVAGARIWTTNNGPLHLQAIP